MTNKKNWLGILVMVLVFGMTVVGCDDGSTDDNTPAWEPITQIPDNYLNTVWVWGTAPGAVVTFGSDANKFDFYQIGQGTKTFTVSPLSSRDQIEKGFDSGLQPSGNTKVISFMNDGSKLYFAIRFEK
jgi:hypothetical protein